MAFTKYSGNLTGQVGSLTTALDAALVTGQGWTITFTATNKRVYRPAAGNQFYFRLDDTGAGTGGATEALIRGAESWSDIDTPNVNPFPSNAQSAVTAYSLVFRKSATADATNRPYIIYADDRTAILFVKSEAGTYYMGPWYFGDVYSLVSGDLYRTVLIARLVQNFAGIDWEPFSEPSLGKNFGDSTTGSYGCFIARNYLGVGTSYPVRHYSDYKMQSGNSFQGYLTAPNPSNGGIYLSRQHFTEYDSPSHVYRFRLRGIWSWCHNSQPYADGDTLSGAGELAGKSFQIVTPIEVAGSVNTIVVETSNTLETN